MPALTHVVGSAPSGMQTLGPETIAKVGSLVLPASDVFRLQTAVASSQVKNWHSGTFWHSRLQRLALVIPLTVAAEAVIAFPDPNVVKYSWHRLHSLGPDTLPVETILAPFADISLQVRVPVSKVQCVQVSVMWQVSWQWLEWSAGAVEIEVPVY